MERDLMFTKEEEDYIDNIINIKMRRSNSNSFIMNYLHNSIFKPEEIIKMKKQILKNRNN